MFGRKSVLWLAAAIGVLVLVVPASASALTGPTACNGATELCEKPLNEVVLPGTHNSMSNQEYGWALPNQFVSIPSQLEMGVRAFLIDTHYGELNQNGKVANVNKNTGHTNGSTMYLCHEFCQLGATELVPELARIAQFLAANPREVLVFVNQDAIHPDDFAAAVTASGLIDYMYTGSTAAYPTLEEMIDTNQRVVMLAEQDSGSVPWYHNAYGGPMQETPYDFRKDEAGNALTTQGGIAQLTGSATLDSTCRPNRGGTGGALFLMNHWVNGRYDNGNGVVPDPEVAAILNTKDVLVARARACEARRGMLPTIIAVDQLAETDGLFAAVDELNGVAPDPEPEPKGVRLAMKVQKVVRVKAGKAAIFRAAVTNTGDTAGVVRVCARVPGRLARKPRCAKRGVKAGQKVTMKLRVRTKARARGRGKVRIIASAAGKSLTRSSTLVVKPKAKKRR